MELCASLVSSTTTQGKASHSASGHPEAQKEMAAWMVRLPNVEGQSERKGSHGNEKLGDSCVDGN